MPYNPFTGGPGLLFMSSSPTVHYILHWSIGNFQVPILVMYSDIKKPWKIRMLHDQGIAVPHNLIAVVYRGEDVPH